MITHRCYRHLKILGVDYNRCMYAKKRNLKVCTLIISADFIEYSACDFNIPLALLCHHHRRHSFYVSRGNFVEFLQEVLWNLIISHHRISFYAVLKICTLLNLTASCIRALLNKLINCMLFSEGISILTLNIINTRIIIGCGS